MVRPHHGVVQPYPTPNAGTPIYVNGRVVGYVACGVFRKTLCGSKHMLRQPRAWAFDQSSLDDAAAAGATLVSILDRENGSVYLASLETIREHGFRVIRGHGNQWALALDHWRINGQEPAAERRAAQTNLEREQLQMMLFAPEGMPA
jgi:hypothetical protein